MSSSKMAQVEVKEKIPREFVRKYLSAKGYKMPHEVMCFDCPGWPSEVFLEHPIQWLYEHVRQGHEPSFDCCHCWDRQVGRDTGEIEEWYRWFTFTWSKEKNDWVVSDTYQGLEGWEEPSPAWCWRRVSV